MSSRDSTGSKPLLVSHAMQLLGDRALANEPLHGGDLSDVIRIKLGSGKDVVVKSGPYPDREGRMLRRLANAGAHVPQSIASNANVLVLENLGEGVSPSERSWRALGRNLHMVHAAHGDRYGWGEDYAFGAVQIHNEWGDNWPEFWFEKRLAADIAKLPADIARQLDELENCIRDAVPAHPLPALLHGDLWSGNVHFKANGEAYLIDPASYFGHAEVDLAMLTLFGSPPKAFWEAYGPLEEGWERRRHAYQLWPALVHLRLFGVGYRTLVERLLSALEP